jgi:hypothetical protein
MPDSTTPRPARPLPPPALAVPTAGANASSAPRIEKTLCDRCGAEMYRMHAVWRCPACGFKTDCCGW